MMSSATRMPDLLYLFVRVSFYPFTLPAGPALRWSDLRPVCGRELQVIQVRKCRRSQQHENGFREKVISTIIRRIVSLYSEQAHIIYRLTVMIYLVRDRLQKTFMDETDNYYRLSEKTDLELNL